MASTIDANGRVKDLVEEAVARGGVFLAMSSALSWSYAKEDLHYHKCLCTYDR